MHPAFFDFINYILPMPEEEERISGDAMREKSYRAGETLLEPGEISTTMRFIIEGAARTYFIDENGRDITWCIHYQNPLRVEKNLFIVDYHSFLTGAPTNLYIEAITDIKVLEIEKTEIERLYQSSKYWNQAGRIVTENVYMFTHRRAFALLTQSAKERYENLCKDDPIITSIVPQYYIASYVGVTPESLSRLKKSS